MSDMRLPEKRRPAVFLDRDGVINEIIYNEDTEQMDSPFRAEDFRLIPGAKEAIWELKERGYYIFVATNQPAAAKGKTTVERIEEVHRFMLRQLGSGCVDKVYTCFHFPRRTALTKDESLICQCGCRKPKPGLLLQARSEYPIDWDRSYMVGDSYTDVLAGASAGVKTVFIGNYKCDMCRMLGEVRPDLIVKDLMEFNNWLKENEPGGGLVSDG